MSKKYADQVRSMEQLRELLEQEMSVVLAGPNALRVLEPGFADWRLYALYLLETYQYTRHNSRNQAAVAVRKDNVDIRYAKFCLNHAMEEAGHEMMALHDLKAIGVPAEESNLPRPLPGTSALIGYLYHVANEGTPVARLGYSYWAERAYEFINPMIRFLAERMGVAKNQMTFFNEHSEIDEKHAQEVDAVIGRHVRTPEEWTAVAETMVQSLRLTATMMDGVLEEFIRMKEGVPTRYDELFAKKKTTGSVTA